MSAPRMTAQNPPDGQIESLHDSVFAKCFKCILRTSRSETAGGRSEWGYADLIETYEKHKREDHDLSDRVHIPVVLLFHRCWSYFLSLNKIVVDSVYYVLHAGMDVLICKQLFCGIHDEYVCTAFVFEFVLESSPALPYAPFQKIALDGSFKELFRN